MPPRILALDRLLRDPRVLNASYGSARTLLQHDIVIWDPEQVLYGYRTGSDYNNAPCLTDDSSVAFVYDFSRRSRELLEFLGLGRVLVLFVPEPFHWSYATGETRNDGTPAKPRLIRLVNEVEVRDILPVDVDLVRAQGEEFKLVSGPPFASFWKEVAEQFYFSGYFGEDLGQTLLTMAGTDRPVAALVEAHGGTVLLLPQLGVVEVDDSVLDFGEDDPDYDEKYGAAQDELDAHFHEKFVDALLVLHEELVQAGDEVLPPWSENYLLPGEADAVNSTVAAQDGLARAKEAVETAQLSLLRLQRRKLLISGTGKALETQVHEALVELGCTVEEGDAGRTDRVATWGNKVAVIEVKGLTKSARESDAAQLEKWVSLYIEQHDRRPKAILAVSAWREVPLIDRTKSVFPNQMLKYAVAREHCLVETGQILAAVMTCKTKTAKNAFLKTLFGTVGVLDGYGWETALAVLTPEKTPASQTSSHIV